MNLKSQQQQVDPLEHRLKSEAIGGSPAFSMSLHQRIMRDIKSAPATMAAPRRPVFWRPLGLAAVAACLAVALLLGRLWMEPSNQGALESKNDPIDVSLVPSFDAVLNTTKPIQQQLKEARFGYVDQDARRLTQFVMNQLDVFPSNDNKDRGM